MSTIRVICGKCSSEAQCPEADAGQKVLCRMCFHTNIVPMVVVPAAAMAPLTSWDNLELESDDSERNARGDDLLSHAAHASHTAAANSPNILFASEDTPPAPPTQAKDPDKALTNVALGIFRMRNWPCQEEPGYRAFRAKVKCRSAQLNTTTIDDYRVFASNGLLILETPVIELPPLPGVPLLETVNEINQRSISSVFVLNKEGVMMRHALIPRARQEGFLTAAMLLQTLRQMNHDRRHALSMLRGAVEKRKLDPVAVAFAFEQPVAACTVPSYTLEQTADLASFAGFYTNMLAGQITLSHEMMGPEKCHVRAAACPGFVRGWVTLGDASKHNSAWTFVPAAFKDFFKHGKVPKTTEILERINELNSTAELVRFTYTKKQVVASAAIFPTDQPTSMEQFKVFSEALLTFASNKAKSAPNLAKAG